LAIINPNRQCAGQCKRLPWANLRIGANQELGVYLAAGSKCTSGIVFPTVTPDRRCKVFSEDAEFRAPLRPSAGSEPVVLGVVSEATGKIPGFGLTMNGLRSLTLYRH